MKVTFWYRMVWAMLLIGLTAPGYGKQEVVPLVNAHSHNDYEHARPLLDALEHGFCSVEADIYLAGGQLLVAHDREEVTPERTLQALYLEPLRRRVRENGGRVYKNGPEFTLLIDVKSDADATYAALREVLKQYADILTVFRQEKTVPRAVTAIISGACAITTMSYEKIRYAGVDGRLGDLDGNINRHVMPLVSDRWSAVFQWSGIGPMPDRERKRLDEIVQQAKRNRVRLRFWATPENPELWRTLMEAGVDLINADDLSKLETFLRDYRPHALKR